MKRLISALLVAFMFMACVSMTISAQRDLSKEEVFAQELKELGLFRGVSETDFDLVRAPSRVEALVMLIRVLGKENEVTEGVWRHPFTDVPKWADKYVGYAYSNALTNGQSQTEFGTGNANAAMYITFVLRALGYSDKNGEDFVWNDPFTLARETGIVSDSVDLENFLRADVVLVSHSALSAYMNGSQQTLAEKLVKAGVFTQNQYNRIYNSGKTSAGTPTVTGALSAEEIYEKCSPAVFYIELYDADGTPIASGSGFFIDDNGTAVTNYHVIEDAYAAKVQTSDTKQVYDILGVYDYSKEYDWAVVKVDCPSNHHLNLSEEETVVGASTIYTIGSPLGFQNTISEGIISNPNQEIGGINFIQISAPISHGSSGGALLNKKGEVLGITSAGRDDGQNLNLAIPVSYFRDYTCDSITPLNLLFDDDAENKKPQPNKHAAYSLLQGFVVENCNVTDEQLGYGYRSEYDAEYGAKEVFTLYASDDFLTLNFMVLWEDESTDSYSLVVYPANDYTVSAYNHLINTKNAGVVSVGFGTSAFRCDEFDEEFEYEFIEYQGDDAEYSAALAKIMHERCLGYLNMLFCIYLSDVSTYGVEDLGYTAFVDDARIAISEITYSLSSQNITVGVGEQVIVELSFDKKYFPSTFIVSVISENEEIAVAEFYGEKPRTLPWPVSVEGVAKGTTYLKITNDYNDQYITVPITVK